jgi:DNA-directed RNA polymerase subunit RPC12/RpoP
MPKLVCNECEEELDYERNKHLYTCPECREGQLEKVREDEGTEVDANVGGEEEDEELHIDLDEVDTEDMEKMMVEDDEAPSLDDELSWCTCGYFNYQRTGDPNRQSTKDDQPDVVQMLDRKTMCCGKRMTYDYTEVGCDIDREWSSRTGSPVSIPRGYTCVASLRCTECCTEICIEIRGKERSQKASEWIKEEIIDV